MISLEIITGKKKSSTLMPVSSFMLSKKFGQDSAVALVQRERKNKKMVGKLWKFRFVSKG